MRKLLAFLPLLLLLSCNGEKFTHAKSKIITAQGHEVETFLAITAEEQEQGLSGVKDSQFSHNQGMLFYYPSARELHFWMPDTYFNLDLIYLDQSFRVLDIIRNLAHHKGRNNENLIPRARGVWAQYVLEMKASSKISREIQIGDQLRIKFSPEAEKKIQNL